MSNRALLFSFIFFAGAIFYNSVHAMEVTQSIEKQLDELDNEILKTKHTLYAYHFSPEKYINLEKRLKIQEFNRAEYKQRMDCYQSVSNFQKLEEMDKEIQDYLLSIK